MMNETTALESFRKLVNEAQKKGETALLIWKNPEEREKWGGKEDEMWVKDAFEVHGFDLDGKAYGSYRTMELTRAMRNAFICNNQLRLATVDGKGLAAMAFQIDKLLSTEGHLMFAFRGVLYKHLNGPIVLLPSCQKVDTNW